MLNWQENKLKTLKNLEILGNLYSLKNFKISKLFFGLNLFIKFLNSIKVLKQYKEFLEILRNLESLQQVNF